MAPMNVTMSCVDWIVRASSCTAAHILKSLLERDGVSYRELSQRLAQIGHPEEEAALRNKINRGTFQFQFFIRCMSALGHREVWLEVRPEPAEK